MGAFGLNLVRVVASLVLFWGVWFLGKTSAAIHKEDIGRFLLCGISGVAANQMLFIKGLTLTSTIHASLLMLVTPLVVTLFALWVLKEAFTVYKALGLFLGIGGSVFLIMQKEAGPHASNYLFGDFLILLNAICYSFYFILVKPLMEKYSPLHVIRWVFTFGLPFIIPFGWNEARAVDWNQFDVQHLLALASIIITGTFLAYYFNGYGLQRLGAGVTGSYIYTQPFFAVLIATVILGETLSWQKLLSGVLIFCGVYLVSFRKKNRDATI